MSPAIVRFDLAAFIAWRAVRDAQTGAWVGICDALKLTAEGETWEDLNRIVAEIVNDLFVNLLQEGRLEEFLRNHGWATLGEIPRPPDHERLVFDIPSRIVPEQRAA